MPTLLYVAMGVIAVCSGFGVRCMVDALLDKMQAPIHAGRCGCRGLGSFFREECPMLPPS